MNKRRTPTRVLAFLLFVITVAHILLPVQVAAVNNIEISSDSSIKSSAKSASSYYYDDAYFNRPSTVYNPSLATLSMHLAMSGSFNMLHRFGFSDITANADMFTEPTAKTMGAVAGRKTLSDEDGEYTLVAIALRSNGYGAEWASNIKVGEASDRNGNHVGFYEARDRALSFLKDYVKNDEGRVKFWLAGFSRGATVAGLIAAWLDDNLSRLPNTNITVEIGDIYAYTFEAPASTARDNVVGKDYSNIHNVINASDIVTKVAMANASDLGWDFVRPGDILTYNGDNVDVHSVKLVPDKTMDSRYEEKLQVMLGHLNTIEPGLEYSPDGFGDEAFGIWESAPMYEVLNYLATRVAQSLPRKQYATMIQPTMMDIVAQLYSDEEAFGRLARAIVDTVEEYGFGDMFGGSDSSDDSDNSDGSDMPGGSGDSDTVTPPGEVIVPPVSGGEGNSDNSGNTGESGGSEDSDSSGDSANSDQEILPDIDSSDIIDPIISAIDAINAILDKISHNKELLKPVAYLMVKKILQKAEINCDQKELANFLSVFVDLLTVEIVDIIYSAAALISQGAPVVLDAHSPAYCLAWLMAYDPSYSGEGAIDFSPALTRIITIDNGAVVSISDGDEKVVFDSRDKKYFSGDAPLRAYVQSGILTVYLPSDESYNLKMSCDKSFNYSLKEYSCIDGKYIRTLTYSNLKSSLGEYTAELSPSRSEGPAVYTLKNEKGGLVKGRDVINDYVCHITIKGGSDAATGSGQYYIGKPVTLSVPDKICYEFYGWYQGDTLLSSEREYSFIAKKNLAITADFTENHTASDWTVAREATADALGIAQKKCSGCGKVLEERNFSLEDMLKATATPDEQAQPDDLLIAFAIGAVALIALPVVVIITVRKRKKIKQDIHQ
ncbi:MAG: hypothetical protein IJX92_08020 [Clostridia bacterium]|nr:hypothetical protein [Clostridia bacterium]